MGGEDPGTPPTINHQQPVTPLHHFVMDRSDFCPPNPGKRSECSKHRPSTFRPPPPTLFLAKILLRRRQATFGRGGGRVVDESKFARGSSGKVRLASPLPLEASTSGNKANQAQSMLVTSDHFTPRRPARKERPQVATRGSAASWEETFLQLNEWAQ